MDLRKLKTLIDLVAESGISELEVSEGEEKVKIVNQAKAQVLPHHNFHNALPNNIPITHIIDANQSNQSSMSHGVSTSINTDNVVTIDESKIIKSPMVGTFYRASSPGAAAFVNVGDKVEEGKTLCIIEAMKLLNEIDSENACTIKQILIENGQPVEYGQALFIIE